MLNLMLQWASMYLSDSEEGQGLVEYALIIVLISIVSITILATLGGSVSSVFTTANSRLQAGS